MSWTSAPLDSLLDVDKLIEVWRAKGMVVHKVRARPCSRLRPARLPCQCPQAPQKVHAPTMATTCHAAHMLV